jgi:hypothetical protein
MNGPSCIGRALEIAREVRDPLHIVMLGPLREVGVVMSAIMRRNGLSPVRILSGLYLPSTENASRTFTGVVPNLV